MENFIFCAVNVPFLHLLKTSEKQKFSNISRGYAKESWVQIGSINESSQLAVNCSKSTTKTLKNMQNMFKINHENTRTTSMTSF